MEEVVGRAIQSSDVAFMNRMFDSEVTELRDAIVDTIISRFSMHLNREAKPGVIFINNDAELLGRAKKIIRGLIAENGRFSELEAYDWLADAQETNLKFL